MNNRRLAPFGVLLLLLPPAWAWFSNLNYCLWAAMGDVAGLVQRRPMIALAGLALLLWLWSRRGE